MELLVHEGKLANISSRRRIDPLERIVDDILRVLYPRRMHWFIPERLHRLYMLSFLRFCLRLLKGHG